MSVIKYVHPFYMVKEHHTPHEILQYLPLSYPVPMPAPQSVSS